MHPSVRDLCGDLAADLREGRKEFTLTSNQVSLLLRGLATALRHANEKDKRSMRAGEDRVLNYFLCRLPRRQTKHDNMPFCCMATVHQIVGEVRSRQRWG